MGSNPGAEFPDLDSGWPAAPGAPRVDSTVALSFLARLFANTVYDVELRALPSAARLFTRRPLLARRFIEEHGTTQNIHFGVATREEGGTKAHCREIVALWADIDFKVTAEPQAWELIKTFPFPPSLVIRSGGGIHLYWLLDGRVEADAHRIEPILRGLTVALRGDNAAAEIAHVMRVPGSLNQKYTPARACNLLEANWERRYALADFEQFTLTPDHHAARASSERSQAISEGQRNVELTRRAGRMRRDGFDEEAISAALTVMNRKLCQPSLPDSEVIAIARSISKYEPEEWREPLPLPGRLPPVEPLLEEMLPEPLRAWCADVAERMQVPLDFPATTTVVALGAVVGRRASIRPKARDRDWEVTPNEWGALIARPGFMKSPAARATLWPLHDLEREAATEYKKELDEYERNRELAELKHEAWKRESLKALKEGRDAYPLEGENLQKPAWRRYIVNDSTVEKLGEILNANPAGVLLFRDELTGFLANLDKPGREGDRAFFLECWNGDSRFAHDRIGRGTVVVEAACLSIFGGIQPGRLRTYLSDALTGGPGDDGLIQRFQLTVWPDDPGPWSNVDRAPNAEARAAVVSLFRRLTKLDPARRLQAHFSREAQELFDDWRRELESRLRSGNLHPALESHLAKYRKLMPSLALKFSLAEAATTLGEADHAVGIGPTKLAAAWCAYLESHAKRAYGCILSPSATSAHLLAEKIKRGELPTSFAARDVYRKCWSGLDRPEAVYGALQVLCGLYWLREEKASDTGGRESTSYRVNPRVCQ
jgi:uncharacterized protein DUF3987/primase-like protein